MRALMIGIGALVLLTGLLFTGQGAGLIDWPASSFMIDQRSWVIRGGLLALAGIALLWYGWKR